MSVEIQPSSRYLNGGKRQHKRDERRKIGDEWSISPGERPQHFYPSGTNAEVFFECACFSAADLNLAGGSIVHDQCTTAVETVVNFPNEIQVDHRISVGSKKIKIF